MLFQLNFLSFRDKSEPAAGHRWNVINKLWRGFHVKWNGRTIEIYNNILYSWKFNSKSSFMGLAHESWPADNRMGHATMLYLPSLCNYIISFKWFQLLNVIAIFALCAPHKGGNMQHFRCPLQFGIKSICSSQQRVWWSNRQHNYECRCAHLTRQILNARTQTQYIRLARIACVRWLSGCQIGRSYWIHACIQIISSSLEFQLIFIQT